MDAITLTTILDENHEIRLKLPQLSPGPVTITIQSTETITEYSDDPTIRREQMRAKLIAAGHLSNARKSPEALQISEEELIHVGKIFSDVHPLADLIDEDREERL
ncbi:MAG: hypothetical protein K8L97_00545 [Anaerolineae bacterium]|nr:hypothetical protein [Anaerolineae bacterium]